MSVENARGGLAALNVGLTAGLIALGYFTFLMKHPPSEGEGVPAYNPTKQAIKVDAKSKDPLRDFQVVWQALDKPLPPPEPPKEAPKPVVPDDLTAKFTVVLIAVDKDPEDAKNYCIIQRKENDKAPDAQQLVKLGSNLDAPFDAFKVVKIEKKPYPKDEKRSMAVVVLEDTKKLLGNGQHPQSTIQLLPAD